MSGQLSSVQEEGLRRAFSRKQVLAPKEQQGLAKLLGIQESRVESWFQARRREREEDVVDIIDLESDEEAMDDISDDESPGETTDNVKKVVEGKGSEDELEEIKSEMAYILKNTVRKEDMEALEAKYAAMTKLIQEKEIQVTNLEAMNAALMKKSEHGKEANVWKAKYSTSVKNIQERDAKINKLEGLIQDYNGNLEQTKKDNANNMERIIKKLESKEQDKSQIKAEVDRLRSELQAGRSRLSKLDSEIVELKSANSSLSSDLAVSRDLAHHQGEELAAVSSDGGEQAERLRFQLLDQADDVVVQATSRRLLEQEVVEVKGRLEAREVEVAECREGLASMAKVQKMQQQVVARIDSQGKIINNQKLMIQQYKEQTQAQLAQIARLAEMQRKAQATSQATSVLNAELGRSRSNEAALNRELGSRARQVLELRRQVQAKVTGSSKAGVREVELGEAVIEYTRILQARRKGQGQEAAALIKEKGATLIPGVLEKEQRARPSPVTQLKVQEQENEVLLRSDPLEEEVVVQVAEEVDQRYTEDLMRHKEVFQGNTGDSMRHKEDVQVVNTGGIMSHKEVVQGNTGFSMRHKEVVQVAEEVFQWNLGDLMRNKEVVNENPGDLIGHKEMVQGNPDDFRMHVDINGIQKTSESLIDIEKVKEMEANMRAEMTKVVREATKARQEKKTITDSLANTGSEVIDILDTTDDSIEPPDEDLKKYESTKKHPEDTSFYDHDSSVDEFVDVDESWSLSSDDDDENDGREMKADRKRSLPSEVEHSYSKRRREEEESVDTRVLVNSLLLSIIEKL